ncbi:MAG TPA: hypothetical protein VNI56_01485 [Xanthomonadaceae bacterium]|nr:hypothetical protein [Xanthomonadaceae bacterium]
MAQGEAMERAIFEFGIRLETIGYLVYCRIITLEAVDDLIGGSSWCIGRVPKNGCNVIETPPTTRRWASGRSGFMTA